MQAEKIHHRLKHPRFICKLLAGHDFSQKYPGVMQAVKEIFPDASVDTYSTVWWITC